MPDLLILGLLAAAFAAAFAYVRACLDLVCPPGAAPDHAP